MNISLNVINFNTNYNILAKEESGSPIIALQLTTKQDLKLKPIESRL